MPLFETVDLGTDYTIRWRISPLALYLVEFCGWKFNGVVLPPMMEGGQ